MKKVISLVLALVMLVSVCVLCTGCGEAKASPKVIDIPLTEEEYAFAVKKGNEELLTKANEYLATIKSNGTFDAIVDRYFGNGEPVAVKSAVKDASKDQLIVATNAAFAPFEYAKGDNFYGVDMEIMAGLAEYLGKELVITDMKFESVCESVANDTCDIAASGLTVNDKRKETLDFTNSYYNASQLVIVLDNDKTFDECKTADEIINILNGFDKNVKIGAQNGTTGLLFIDGDEDWGFDGLTATSVGFDNGGLAVQALVNGSINYVIIDEAPAKKIVEGFTK